MTNFGESWSRFEIATSEAFLVDKDRDDNPAQRQAFRLIFLSAGLKYQETMVSIRSSVGPKYSEAASPTAKCVKIAPDIKKKKPA